ncbi:MAG: exonuclease domain-containing protein [Polyangiales bacterium]
MRLLPKFLKNLFSNGPLPATASDWPGALRDYMAKKRRPPRSTPLAEIRFVVFDSETSGLDLAKNRLLSIAGVAMAGPEVQLDDAFEAIVAQVDVGGANAAVIHGLVSNDLAGGLPEDEAAARFLSFAGDAVLVAHHAAFDIQMLRKAIAAHRGATVWNPTIDTARLAERVEVGPMSSSRATGTNQSAAYRLDSLVERYGIDVPERHTAAGDALATALLFQRLLKKAERRGIHTLGDLLSR